MPAKQSHINQTQSKDSGGFNIMEGEKTNSVSRRWDKIFKRGQHLRDTLGQMTPSLSGTDLLHNSKPVVAVRADSIKNSMLFQRNQSQQVLPSIKPSAAQNSGA